MNEDVLQQIGRLGGTVERGRVEPLGPDDGGYGPWPGLPDRFGGGSGGPVADELLSVSFPRPLQRRPEPSPWDPTGLDILDSVIEKYPETMDDEGEVRIDVLVDRAFRSPDGHYDQIRYDPWVFSPFTPGSPLLGELDGLVTQERLREVFDIPAEASGPLEFVMIAHTESFPNYYVVASLDPAPENPRVFSTDHETFFWDQVEPRGTLAEFLDGFVTESELRRYLEETLGGDDG